MWLAFTAVIMCEKARMIMKKIKKLKKMTASAAFNKKAKYRSVKTKILKKTVKASFTIEVAVIVPITLVIVLCVIFAALYIHDSVIVKAVNTDVSVENIGNEDADSDEIASEIRQKLENSLLVADADEVDFQTDSKSNGFKAITSGNLDAPVGMAAKILPDNMTEIEYELRTANVNARQTLNGYKAICDGIDMFSVSDSVK